MGSNVYYLRHLEPLIQRVSGLLEPYDWSGQWLAVDSLDETEQGSPVVADEVGLGTRQQALLPARRVLLVVESWSLERCAQWLSLGVRACCDGRQPERLAAELLALRSRQAASADAYGETDLLQSVINAIPVPIFYKDALHIYRGCNSAFAEYLGLSRDKILGSSVYDVAPRELADRYYEADQKLLATGGTQRYEAPVRYADGSYRDIEFNKAVYFGADGRVGGQVGVMLDVTERNHLTRQLEQYSRTDPLTGAGNRREFDAVAQKALRHHRQKALPLSLMVLDVDHFKQINDRWGHSVGDQALRFLVQQCLAQLRADDRLFRTGGEEFCIVLPGVDAVQARQVAERLCGCVEAKELTLGTIRVQMTVSIGVVELAAGDDIGRWFERADQALYQAKRAGRNCVVLASDEG